MAVGRCMRSCMDCRSTDSVGRADSSPSEEGSPGRLVERYPEEERARPVVVEAVAAAVVAVAVVAAVVVAGAQTVLSRHRATHYVYRNHRSAVGHMSHRSSKSRATDPPQANANQKKNSPVVGCRHSHIQQLRRIQQVEKRGLADPADQTLRMNCLVLGQ